MAKNVATNVTPDVTENVEEDTSPDATAYRNLYQTKILPPWSEPEPEKELAKPKPRRDFTIALTDENAEDWGDITRVGWKGRVEYAVNRYIEERNRAIACRDDPYRDPNSLLQATISTIILLAANAEVSRENVLYAELYLKNIKDETGDHPPNISNFLKYLRYIKKQKNIEVTEEYRVDPPDNLIVTKISKKSKIPVKLNRSDQSGAPPLSPAPSAPPSPAK